MLDDPGQPKLMGNVVVDMGLIAVFSKTRVKFLRKNGNCRAVQRQRSTVLYF